MRNSGLLGAAIALSMLTPIAPANADISPGELMYTDFFRWPNWREILAKYDCTTELTFYLWNAPFPSPQVVITPPPIFDPVVAASSGEAVDPPDPIGAPGGDAPGGPPTGAGFRRSKRTDYDKRNGRPARQAVSHAGLRRQSRLASMAERMVVAAIPGCRRTPPEPPVVSILLHAGLAEAAPIGSICLKYNIDLLNRSQWV